MIIVSDFMVGVGLSLSDLDLLTIGIWSMSCTQKAVMMTITTRESVHKKTWICSRIEHPKSLKLWNM